LLEDIVLVNSPFAVSIPVFGRRFAHICLEGLYYTFVLAFIVSGAAVQDVNLLFVLAAMMTGPLLFNWRVVAQAIRRVEVNRQLPQQVYAGRPFRVEIHAENCRRRMGSWMLVVEDAIEPDANNGGRKGRQRKTKVSVMLPFVAARGSGRGAYRATVPRRGKYRFGPLRLSTRFPLGLVKATARVKQFERLVVCPRLGRLTPDWLRVVDSERTGRHEMHRRQGPMDGDYYGLREWRPGDSKRWIHWRTTAKLGKLAVRQFEQQQNRDMALVLDLWEPDEPSDEDRARTEFAVSLAATMVDQLARRGGSQLMIALAARRSGWWSATAGAVFARKMMELLATVRATSDDRLAEVLGGVLANAPLGAQVCVISTRSTVLEDVSNTEAFAAKPRHQRALDRVAWLDVDDSQVSSVFQLE